MFGYASLVGSNGALSTTTHPLFFEIRFFYDFLFEEQLKHPQIEKMEKENLIERQGETIEIEDDDHDSLVISSEDEEEEEESEDIVTLSAEEAKKYKEYVKKHSKYKEQYIQHPRYYSQVNFKKSNTGYSNISMRSNGTFQCALTIKGLRHVKTVKNIEEATVIDEKWRKYFT